MREIKFRAWDKEAKFMVDREYWLVIDTAGEVYEYNLGKLTNQTSQYEIMQYTGLEDKNGISIYEGDIIQIRNKETRGVVKFFDSLTWDGGGSSHSGYFCEEWFDDNGEPEYGYSLWGAEIVGNIYQNKDLLTN